jgi:DNA-directed RNA polymerase specialized sigma24 family protein
VVFDEEACARLLESVHAPAGPAWRELVAMLWPELSRLVRATRAMVVLGRSEDHVQNVVLLVVEKLGKDRCRAARLERAWRDAHPDKTLGDWLRIVTANVARDYVRERRGRARGDGNVRGDLEARLDKRMLASLATLLPDDDDLAPSTPMLSQTSRHAAHELARWAEHRLPPDQLSALTAWLQASSFEEIAAELGVADAAAAKRVVRAAVAALRRHATAA